jgi:hypothetical protein
MGGAAKGYQNGGLFYLNTNMTMGANVKRATIVLAFTCLVTAPSSIVVSEEDPVGRSGPLAKEVWE